MAGDPKGSERGRGSLCPTPPPGGCASLSLGLRQSPSSVCPCALLRKPPRAGTAEPVLAQLLGGPQLQLPGLCGHPLQVRPTTGWGGGAAPGRDSPGLPPLGPTVPTQSADGGVPFLTDRAPQVQTASHSAPRHPLESGTGMHSCSRFKNTQTVCPPGAASPQLLSGVGWRWGHRGRGDGCPKSPQASALRIAPPLQRSPPPHPPDLRKECSPSGWAGGAASAAGGLQAAPAHSPCSPRPRLGQGPLSCSPVLPPSPANSL